MQTLFDKIWNEHSVTTRDDGTTLLYIDRHLLHEVTSPQAFDGLRALQRKPRRPALAIAVQDHSVPTTSDRGTFIADPESRLQLDLLVENTQREGIELFDLHDARQGIVHVMAPEQGLILPGSTAVCGDSHTATLGALGAVAFGIGTSEVEHVLATQTLWLRKPAQMRVTFEGELPPYVSAKDMALALIREIGTAGGTGCAIEYAGPTVRALSQEGRLTLCNMTIEAGARMGFIAPDEVTLNYLKGRPGAPQGAQWDALAQYWAGLHTDAGAQFDYEVVIDVSQLLPQVTWGTSPQDVMSVDGSVPLLDDAAPAERERVTRGLQYMGLQGGEAIAGLRIDRVFIGSCTNSRIEDLRSAAGIVKGRQCAPSVRAMVVPGSGQVKLQAEQEGLAQIFVDAGFEWREPGCSMCIAMNGDKLDYKERCASTSNRNFEGRQGAGGRTHLMSPAMAAAAAVAGHITDVREFYR